MIITCAHLAGFSDSIMEAFPTGTLKTSIRDLKMSNIEQQLPTRVLSSQLFTTLFSLSILTKNISNASLYQEHYYCTISLLQTLLHYTVIANTIALYNYWDTIALYHCYEHYCTVLLLQTLLQTLLYYIYRY